MGLSTGNVITITGIIIHIVITFVAVAFFMGTYKQKILNLEKGINEIKEQIKGILSQRSKLTIKIAKFEEWRNVTTNKSPLHVSDYGEKMLDDCGFMKIFEEIKDELIQEIEKQKPKNK